MCPSAVGSRTAVAVPAIDAQPSTASQYLLSRVMAMSSRSALLASEEPLASEESPGSLEAAPDAGGAGGAVVVTGIPVAGCYEAVAEYRRRASPSGSPSALRSATHRRTDYQPCWPPPPQLLPPPLPPPPQPPLP